MTSNLKPFIPAWLDDAGLSAAEMRVFIHLLRSADNKTGIAWPSYRRMTEITGMSKSTIRRCIESLENDHNLIALTAKPFAGSCRYRVLPIVPPEGQMRDINSSTRGTNEASPIVPPEADNSPSSDTSIVPPEGQEGNPRKGIQGRVSNKESKSFTTESVQFAQWFKSSLPENTNLSANWRESFAQEFEDMIRIDKRSPDEIREVCRWARQDEFWRSNFYSPVKLRKRKDGVQYYDTFLQKMKSSKPPTSVPSTPSNPSLRTPTFI
jgi:hypothetical protein